MLREVFEETSIDLSQEEISYLGKVYVRDPKKDFVYYMFKCEIPSKPKEIFLAEDEHFEYTWLDPKKALTELLLVPGEDECIHLIYGSRREIQK
jgi:8-oxo-dGTP pyrophosphatase MutT (NUDIX family)